MNTGSDPAVLKKGSPNQISQKIIDIIENVKLNKPGLSSSVVWNNNIGYNFLIFNFLDIDMKDNLKNYHISFLKEFML